MGASRDTPADDAPREGVDHERYIDETGPGRVVAEVRDPQRIRPRRLELPVHTVQRAWRSLVAHRRADDLAADDAFQAQRPHEARDRAAGDLEALALQLSPHLAHAIDPEVLVEHTLDLAREHLVSLGPLGPPGRIAALGGVLMVGRRGNRQHPADRLDPVHLTMIIDDGDHGLKRRSSSALAKKTPALPRVSFALRSSPVSPSR